MNIMDAIPSNSRHTTWITRSLKEIITDLSIFMQRRKVLNIDIADGYKWRMEMISRKILALEVNGELDETECKAVDFILKAFSVVNKVVDKLQNYS